MQRRKENKQVKDTDFEDILVLDEDIQNIHPYKQKIVTGDRSLIIYIFNNCQVI
jgi:hypothetical protein